MIDYLANTLTQKLMHAPTRQLREAGENGHQALIEAARTLFDLKDP